MCKLFAAGLMGVLLIAVSWESNPTAVSDEALATLQGSTSKFSTWPGHHGSNHEHRARRGRREALLEFDQLVGVPRPFAGPDNPIRGVVGGLARSGIVLGRLPWVIHKGEAELDVDGELRVEVEGLVLDPNDPQVIASGVAGNNPVGAFKAMLSCLTVDGSGNAATVNLETAAFPATTGVGGGDAHIRETLANIPDPCIAPILFVIFDLPGVPQGGWLAATGVHVMEDGEEKEDEREEDPEEE